MSATLDLSVADGGFKSPEEARAFADRIVGGCITSKRLAQEVIADAFWAVQQAVERKYQGDGAKTTLKSE